MYTIKNFQMVCKTFLTILSFLIFGLNANYAISEDKPQEPAPTKNVSIDTSKVNEIFMVKGELETLTVDSLTRLSITDPEVADIVSGDDKQLLVVAKNVGQTVLFFWDEHGKRTFTIHVFAQNLERVKERISRLLDSVDIHDVKLEIIEKEGQILVSGNVPEDKKAQFDQVMSPFADNLMK